MVVEQNYWCYCKPYTQPIDISTNLNFEAEENRKHHEDWMKEDESMRGKNHNMLIGIENIAAELKAIM